MNVLFRQLFDQTSSTYTYLLADPRTRDALLIDCVFEQHARDAREEDFVGFMTHLGLPHPKLLDLAVPANLRSGEPVDGQAPTQPDWGPVVTTYAGLAEIAPEWVAEHRDEIDVVDVRAASELEGELGHLAGVRNVPLDELRARVAEIDATKPVVVVCQTGKRSSLATLILRKAGIARVANVAGGMVAWRRLGLPD